MVFELTAGAALDAIRDWASGDNKSATFIIKATSESGTGDNYLDIYSEDNTSVPEYCPRLEITYKSGLDLGHRVLRDKGFQIQAVVHGSTDFNTVRWEESNFTAIDWQQNRAGIDVAEDCGLNWKVQGGDVTELPPSDVNAGQEKVPYKHRIAYEVAHEPNILNAAEINDLAAKYAVVRDIYPGVPLFTTLDPTNFGLDDPYTDAQITNFINTVKPDFLIYDDYTFSAAGSPPPPHHLSHFRTLDQFRDVAIIAGIPYGTYMQTWLNDGSTECRVPSESDIRFDLFSALVYGYKMLDNYIYDGWGSESPIKPVLFEDDLGTENPTVIFDYVAAANTEVKNLGRTLVYLKNTDVRFITSGTLPDRTVAWQSGACDPYITSITVTSADPDDDVVIGYFKPMLESDDGSADSNQIYFMAVNCRHAYNQTAPQATQTIRVDFNFSGTSITQLQRLNRWNGNIEPISTSGSYNDLGYESLGGSSYRLTLQLKGGSGELFKFNTGAPFVIGPLR